jgi:hypothetical protein
LLKKECSVCQGKTTGVIDVADLSEGFTFINKNLFPILYPLEMRDSDNPANKPGPEDRLAYGLHFLQWTSSQHNKDWHNMPLADRVVVLKRLAVLEKKLLSATVGGMPAIKKWGKRPGRLCVYRQELRPPCWRFSHPRSPTDWFQ